MYVNNKQAVCMQVESRRTNKERSLSTRAALIAAARGLFVERGFAATGTPEIVAAAGVTRGALYHHFADKDALFKAVVLAEAEAVAAAIRSADFSGLSPMDALIRGGSAFLAAMQLPGRTRLMLIDAPAVLPRPVLDEIDALTGGATLVEGLAAALPSDAPIDELAALLSAAFDRAALAIDAGQDPAQWRVALAALMVGLVG
jgi:AcrR family transcriptional regulator